MSSISVLLQNFWKGKRGLQDLLVVDLDAMGSRCLRLLRAGDGISVAAAGLFPALDLSSEALQADEKVAAFPLPRPFLARHVVMSIPAEEAVVKLLSLPGQVAENLDAKVREHMGLEEGNYRIGYRVLTKGHGRTETRLLTVAVPEIVARAACRLFPIGIPAPISIEVAGLAAVTAFANGPLDAHKDEAVAVLDCGAKASMAGFFHKGELVLIRKLDFGTLDMLARIRKDLGVDAETAKNVLADGSFDISHSIREVSEPFIKQLVISRLFVERRENCRLSRIFVPGGAGTSHSLLNEIKSAMGFDVDGWDPFACPKLKVPDGVLDKAVEGQRSQFANAIGAALAGFEEA